MKKQADSCDSLNRAKVEMSLCTHVLFAMDRPAAGLMVGVSVVSTNSGIEASSVYIPSPIVTSNPSLDLGGQLY
jgi:hypothetical protein